MPQMHYNGQRVFAAISSKVRSHLDALTATTAALLC
jgi:hypothetical protein